MKSIFILFFLVFSSLAYSSEKIDSSSYQYVSKKGGYKIKFPSKPTEIPMPTNVPEAERTPGAYYEDVAQQLVYSSSYQKIPSHVDLKGVTAETLLPSEKDQAKQPNGVEVLNQNKINQNGMSGVETILKALDGSKSLIRVYINLASRTICSASVSSKKGDVTKIPEARVFLDSFNFAK